MKRIKSEAEKFIDEVLDQMEIERLEFENESDLMYTYHLDLDLTDELEFDNE